MASALLGCGAFQTASGLGSGHLCLAEALLDVCGSQAQPPAQLATMLLLWLLARPCTSDVCTGLLPAREWVQLALAACSALEGTTPRPTLATSVDLKDSVLHRLAQFRLLASRAPETPAWAVLWLLWHANSSPVPADAWPAVVATESASAEWELCQALSVAAGLPWAETARPSALDTALGWLRQPAQASITDNSSSGTAPAVVRGALSPSCGWCEPTARPWYGEPRAWEPVDAGGCRARRAVAGRAWYNQRRQRSAVTAGDRDAGLALLWLRARVAGARLSRNGDKLTLWLDQAAEATERALQLVRALGLGADSRTQLQRAGALARLQCARRDSAPEKEEEGGQSRFPSWPLPRTVEGWGEGAFTWGHLLQAEAGQCDSLDWTLAGRAARRVWWSTFWQLQAIDGVRTLVLTSAWPDTVEWLARVQGERSALT
eukprot:g82716.t1